MEEGSWLPQESTKHSHGAMAEEEEEDLGSVSSFSDDDEGCGPSTASSGLSTPASSDDGLDDHEGRLYDMSNLMAQLPLKRGLSRFFDGKSQSFTSLADAKMLQDLPKTDRSSSCKKQNQTKTCKSSANVHTNIYSKTIRKVKMRPSRSGHLMCSSVLAYCCNEKQDADFASTESKQRSVLR